MTRKEAESLLNLNREIRLDRKRLAEFEKFIVSAHAYITGMPHLNVEKKDEIIDKITAMRDSINQKINRTVGKYQEIMEFIDSIEDSWSRQLITLRCLNCLSWVRIALFMGGSNTPDGVKKAYYRCFEKLEKKNAK